MGSYNPHSPYILGQEFVPIRDASLYLSPAVNALEAGHGFTLTQARQVGSGRFYVAQRPEASASAQVIQVSVYPDGYEDLSGPIRSVIIPVTTGSVTGASFTGGSLANALGDPADNRNLQLGSGSSPTDGKADLYFGVNTFAQLLNRKRIVGVDILYQVSSTSHPDELFFTLFVGPPTLEFFRETATSYVESDQIERWHLGEVSPFFSNDAPSTTERAPWTYDILQRFEATAANRIRAKLAVTSDVSASLTLTYVAMEVFYCEETRVAVGGAAFGSLLSNNLFSGSSNEYALGANIVPMRGIPGLALNPVLPAGQYSVVVSSPSVGVEVVRDSPYPQLSALQELYALPTHPGVDVLIPTPPEDHIGDVFEQSVSLRLPQLSLHATGGSALTEPHVYGRQAAAQVYGTVTATQTIYDDVVGVATPYPWVRFYARRFGDTTVSLTLDSIDAAASQIVVTPAEYDALPDIIDGWKEITKRFDTPPNLGAVAGSPAFRWGANGELAGNRWEILAACAPAISGVPGLSPYQLAPSGQLTTGTYDPADPAGAFLAWMPQGVGSAPVSGASADLTTDAVLIFSTDPPTITGVGLTTAYQPVTGISNPCGGLPCCIVTGIGYNALTWSAQTTLPTTGFGAYELQRYDSRTAAWQTIMLATNPAVTGFHDYEPRVGVTSVYRIRTWNALSFYGQWSAQVSGAPPAPGVVGGCDEELTPLIFTTNAAQSGALNAAYAQTWAGAPDESFSLPEGDQVAFQPMYDRDGVVAFHGSERGLETFARTVLIHSEAFSPSVLADVTTLRDLAWADVPYVCVRDHRGNRWFGNVRVTDVSATNDATIVMASVAVVETNTEPAAVDP